MAKQLTHYAGNAIGNWFRGVTPPPVSNLSVALYTTAPTTAGGGTKVTGGSYTDLPVTLSAFASSASSNTNALTFINLPACTITGVALVDGVTGDVLWFDNGLSVTVTAGQNRTVLVGDFDVAFIA